MGVNLLPGPEFAGAASGGQCPRVCEAGDDEYSPHLASITRVDPVHEVPHVRPRSRPRSSGARPRADWGVGPRAARLPVLGAGDLAESAPRDLRAGASINPPPSMMGPLGHRRGFPGARHKVDPAGKSATGATSSWNGTGYARRQTPYPVSACMLRFSTRDPAAHRRLRRWGGAEVRFAHNVPRRHPVRWPTWFPRWAHTPDGIETYAGRYLVGAYGGRSRGVRHANGVAFEAFTCARALPWS